MIKLKKRLAGGVAALMVAGLLVGTASAAMAADPPQAWDPLVPHSIIAQHNETTTTLYDQVKQDDGSLRFTTLFQLPGLGVNSIGYAASTGLVYATVQTSSVSGFPEGSVIAIGENGGYERLGNINVGQRNTGAVGDDGYYYVYQSRANSITKIDLNGGVIAATINLSEPVNIPDFAWYQGYLVGQVSDSGDIVRINPGNGNVRRFNTPLPSGPYGAAWVYGNGNLGFANNNGGSYQLSVSNFATTNPTFRILNRSTSPASINNDGTSIPGAPADLAVAKTEGSINEYNNSVNYTLTVTNLGEGGSSGGFIRDTLPAEISGTGPLPVGCSATADVVTCDFPAIAVGDSKSFSFEAFLRAPLPGNQCFSNTATVVGNELDSVLTNNSSTVASCNPQPDISVVKSVDPESGSTVNAGQDVSYTLTFSNAGQAAGPVAYDDVIAGVLDDADVTVEPATSSDSLTASAVSEGRFTVGGALEAGQTETVTYTVKVKADGERGDNLLANFVVPEGTEPPAECEVGSPLCTENPIPYVTVVKSVDPESGSTVTAGQDVSYTLTFSNIGQAAGPVAYDDVIAGVLDDADVTVEPATSSDSLTASAVSEGRFTVGGALEVGQTETVTYTVKVKADGERGDNLLANFVVPEGTEPPAECVEGNQLCTENPIPEIGSWKTSDPSSSTPIVSGQEVTYTLHFENIGKATGSVTKVDRLVHVLDDANVTVEPVSKDSAWTVGRDGDTISISGALAAGDSNTVSYTVKVKEAKDRGDNILANFLLSPDAEVPTTPECVPTDQERADCTTHPVGQILPEKSANPETGTTVKAGEKVTYTLSFTNVGAGAAKIDYIDHMADVLDDAELVGAIKATGGATVSGPMDNQLLVGGTVAPGETATVVYTVKVNAYDKQANNKLGNFLTPSLQDPPAVCVPENPLCTEHPIEPKPATALPTTGTSLEGMLLSGLLLAGLGGGALLLAQRYVRRREESLEG